MLWRFVARVVSLITRICKAADAEVKKFLGTCLFIDAIWGCRSSAKPRLFSIMWDNCALSERGVWSPLVVRKVQPSLRSFFNGNGQTNLYQYYSYNLG